MKKLIETYTRNFWKFSSEHSNNDSIENVFTKWANSELSELDHNVKINIWNNIREDIKNAMSGQKTKEATWYEQVPNALTSGKAATALMNFQSNPSIYTATDLKDEIENNFPTFLHAFVVKMLQINPKNIVDLSINQAESGIFEILKKDMDHWNLSSEQKNIAIDYAIKPLQISFKKYVTEHIHNVVQMVQEELAAGNEENGVQEEPEHQEPEPE